jgi:hypothetical protein
MAPAEPAIESPSSLADGRALELCQQIRVIAYQEKGDLPGGSCCTGAGGRWLSSLLRILSAKLSYWGCSRWLALLKY